jgi:hypothetical protein
MSSPLGFIELDTPGDCRLRRSGWSADDQRLDQLLRRLAQPEVPRPRRVAGRMGTAVLVRADVARLAADLQAESILLHARLRTADRL